MLRVIPHKLSGVATMFGAIAVLFLLPWIDRGKVRSIRYRGRGFKVALFVFALSFVLLGAVGAGVTTELIPAWLGPNAPANAIENWIGRLLVCIYFGYFAFLWVYTRFGIEKPRTPPDRVPALGAGTQR